ncbi:MAG TPA: PilW family protein [Gammaproteobacteria bacterium]|nr:PilW family protein [Gammaproteobacteria bacterium]
MNTHKLNLRVHSLLPDRQQGLSLVELMVALIIGLILTAGVISVYLTSKKSYSSDTGLAQVQENGRFALSFLEPVVRMAGFEGCVTPRKANPTSIITGATGNPLYDYSVSGSGVADPTSATVIGYDAVGTDINDSITLTASQSLASASGGQGAASWTPAVDSASAQSIYSTISGLALTNSDILVVHEASADNVPVVDNPAGSGTYNQTTGIYIPSSDVTDFTVGQLAILSDCEKATLFQITGNSGGSGPLTYADSASPGNGGWSGTYNDGSRVSAAQTYVYFIGLSSTDQTPALFQVELASNGQLDTPTELVPDIENMQILYGVDTDSDHVPNRFVSASTVNANGDWNNVVAVRIALLARSDDKVADAAPATAPSFDLNGVTVTTPIDRRIRRTFVQTIALRNMLP